MAISFYSRLNGLTLSAVDDLPGTNPVGTLNGAAVINATAALAGSNGLQVLGAGDAFKLDAETAIINPLVGSLGFLFRVQTWAAGATMLRIRGSSYLYNMGIYMIGASGSGNLRLRINEEDASQIDLDGAYAGIQLNTTYYCDASWDQPNNDRRIRLYDASGVSLNVVENTSVAFTAPVDLTHPNGFSIGEAAGMGTPAIYIDNAFLGKAYADANDFLSNRNITSYTQYSVASSQHDPFVKVLFKAA
ncbi:MAG: hypothetical protein Q7U76_12900 [Nitrospirota bacterium]|nr:hypothetical protein [Nitrospirota bacterium]